jgi:hypothetical protein
MLHVCLNQNAPSIELIMIFRRIRYPTKMAIVTINGDLVPKSVIFLSTGPLTLSL